MFFDEYTIDQLVTVRKVLDSMIENVGDLMGKSHALSFLLPELANSPDFSRFMQVQQQFMYATNTGMPTIAMLREYSRAITTTIEEKQRKAKER